MALNKLQLKGRIFELIEPLRNLGAVDDSIISDVLSKIRKIKEADFEFISRILIKEADCKNPKSGTAFLFIAENLAPESFLGLVLNELNSSRTNDDKKMFYINILSGLGVRFLPEDVSAYLNNPEEAIAFETKRFLDSAKIDPEAQIDFLDFYFSSSPSDKIELINSVVEDFEGDRLANILSPLVLTIDEIESVLYCLDVLEKTNSLLEIKPLEYLSHSKNTKIQKKASKILRKAFMKGFYTQEKLNAFYKELLEDFENPIIRMSLPDGNSNFTLAISRKTKNEAYAILFVALNTELGPFSSFGFSSLTKTDCEAVLTRFLAGSKEIIIPNEIAKKIMDELVIKRIGLSKIIPYEFYCWERIIDDIEPSGGMLEDILTGGLHLVNIGLMEEKIIINSPFVQNWFYRYSKNLPDFAGFIDKIMKLKQNEVAGMEDLIFEFSKNQKINSNLILRIKYLAFALKCGGYQDFADIYYSLLFNKSALEKFIINILKRSVYEHVLSLRLPVKNRNIFKKIELKRASVDTAHFIDYIEKNWTE